MPITKSRQIAKLFKPNGIIKESLYDSDAIVTSAQLGVTAAAGTTIYSSADTLPASADNGDQALVTSTNRLYIYSNGGWYNIALINSTPYWITEADGSYTLSTTGGATIIEILAGDSDGTIPSYTATIDSDFNQVATITQDSDSRWIITPIDSENGTAVAGTGTVTFRATDGVNLISTLSSFSLTFGPDWTSGTPTESKVTASDGVSGDLFGMSVSLSEDGNYAMVGASSHDTGGTNAGAAYVYVRSGSSWSQQQKIQASDTGADRDFGYFVSLNSDGTYALIGSYGHEAEGANAGQAYVFTRSGSTWTQQQRFTGSDVEASDNFGKSGYINSDGTYAIVGARGDDGSGNAISSSGAAYIFTRSGSTWTEQAILRPSNAGASDIFAEYHGVSMNSTGDYVVVGSRLEDGAADNISASGAAYVFTRSGSTWTEQAILRASDAQASDYFGTSVSINGDGTYIAIGAAYAPNSVKNGAVYVFTRSGSTWTEQAKLTASDGEGNDQLGWSIAISSDGKHIISGARYEGGGSGNPISNTGAAYIFSRSGSSWSQARKLNASDAAADDVFGYHTAISNDGTYVMAGARDKGAPSGAGAAYIYEAG